VIVFENTVGAGFIPAHLELQATKNRLERFLTLERSDDGPEGILQDSKM
jgi:hypothetical protein